MNTHPTPKTWGGGGTFDIVSPTFKNVGDASPYPPPPDLRPCLLTLLIAQNEIACSKMKLTAVCPNLNDR